MSAETANGWARLADRYQGDVGIVVPSCEQPAVPTRRSFPIRSSCCRITGSSVKVRSLRPVEQIGLFDGAATGGRLSHNALDTMLDGERTSSEAVSGSGKNLAYLTPAFLVAATRSERSVMSTESIALQHQVIGKDAPAAAGGAATVLHLSNRRKRLSPALLP